MKKDCYFKIVAGILPIVLILLLEGGLRLVGFGNNLSLFVQDGKQDYLRVNRVHEGVHHRGCIAL